MLSRCLWIVHLWQDWGKEIVSYYTHLTAKEQMSARSLKWPIGSISEVLRSTILQMGVLALEMRTVMSPCADLIFLRRDMYDDSCNIEICPIQTQFSNLRLHNVHRLEKKTAYTHDSTDTYDVGVQDVVAFSSIQIFECI